MKHILYSLFIPLFICPGPVQAQFPAIQVVYPYEGQRLPDVKQTFIFGNVAPAKGTLHINGEPVRFYHNGAFLAYLPVSKGDFSFNLEFSPEAGQPPVLYKRTVKIGQEQRPPLSAEKPQWDELSVQPAADVEYGQGDCVQISAKGSPSMKADFSIDGLAKRVEMTELPPASGQYYGLYCIGHEDESSFASIEVRLSKGWSRAKAQAKGRLSVAPKTPKVAEITLDNAGLRSDYDGGYYLFGRAGTKLRVTGRVGDRLRAELSPSQTAWIDESRTKPLPQGTPLPKALMGTIKTVRDGRSTKVQVSLTSPVPYTTETSKDGLELTFFYTRNFTNWVIYDSSDTFVREIRWRQLNNESCGLSIQLEPGRKLWGYDINYSSGSMTIELREPPTFSCHRKLPLEGLTIALDPGHSPRLAPPFDGAVGPSGTFEYVSNYLIAKDVAAVLTQKGATVVFTRGENEEVPLQNRPLIAWAAKADIFISFHNNALPDGENPLLPGRGFSVYYYHPFSLDFAKEIHAGFRKHSPLPDEGLRFGDYLVIRQTQMPSVLVECAYQIIPAQELLLDSAEFRHKLALAVLNGLNALAKTLTVTGNCQPSRQETSSAKAPKSKQSPKFPTPGRDEKRQRYKRASGKPAN